MGPVQKVPLFMRKILKGAGAATLAAATVVTGLSFGPAALASPTKLSAANASSKSVPQPATEFQLITPTGDGGYYGYVGDTAVKRFESRALAEQGAWTFSAVVSGDTFRAFFSKGGTGYGGTCLTDGSTLGRLYLTSQCTTSASLFKIDDAGRLHAVASDGYVGVPTETNLVYPTVKTGEAAYFEGLNASLNAKVDSVDVLNQTAQLSGTGKPNSTIIIGADQQVPVNGESKWSATVENLNFGDNTIHLENWVGSTLDSEKDITVSLNAANITGVASSTATATDDITISGNAQPGADIKITNESGKTVATTSANATTGRYNALIPAPNAGGTHIFTVTQSIKGTNVGSTSVAFDYGAAVSITSPIDDLVHPGGPLDFSGKGAPNSQVKVTEEGKPGVIATGTVLVNGNWSIKNVNLDAREHNLVVTQTSVGNNVTTDKVTLNPGQTGVTKPLAITTPTEGSTVIDKHGTVVFTGTGTSGQKVTLQGANGGRVLGTSTVDDNGNWTYTTWLSESHFDIDATMGSETKTVSFDVRKSAGITQPLEITTPTEGSTVSNSTGTVVFTGKGTTGQKVKLQGANGGRVLGETTVKSDGSWTYTTWLSQSMFMIDATMGAEKKMVTFNVDKGEAVTNPLTITAPASNSEAGVSGRLDWTGTGKAGETISIVNQYGVTKTTTKVLSNGTWAVTTYDMIANTYDYTLTQTGTNESAKVTGIVVK
ncbi:MAG: hypothetical protein JWP75_2507 [Frondihabitans sp.]|nr:hypothetical protein [Frondihabitans sp.]